MNDLTTKISHSKFILFADLKIYRDVNVVDGCKFLQADINSTQQLCDENCMVLNIRRTNIISLIRKTKGMHFN